MISITICKMTNSLPILTVERDWEELLRAQGRAALEQALPAYIQPRRWFGGKARGIAAAQIVEAIPLSFGGELAYITLVRIQYAEGQPDTYVLPLAFADAARAAQLLANMPHA